MSKTVANGLNSYAAYPLAFNLQLTISRRQNLTFFYGWGETESTWYVGHCWPIVPAPDDR
jgi:hypothetical protein